MGERFEFDELKSRSNLEKHGIDFQRAQRLWDGPVIRLRSRNRTEDRELVIGRIETHHWTAIVTRREEKIRIISVRRSRDEEKEIYDRHFCG